jgi:hypothetical protein
MKKLLHIVLLGGLMLSVVGCGEDTPQQTVETLRTAMLNSDQAGFLSCFDASDPQKQLLAATFDMEIAQLAFRSEVTEVFGPSAAEKFGGDNPFVALVAMDPDEFSFTVDGDRASLDGVRGFWEFAKVDGEWKIALGYMVAEPAQIDKGVTTMGLVEQVYRAMFPKVSQEGMTVEQLQADLLESMDALRRQHAYTEHEAPSSHVAPEENQETPTPE